jgi:hypothetical protein
VVAEQNRRGIIHLFSSNFECPKEKSRTQRKPPKIIAPFSQQQKFMFGLWWPRFFRETFAKNINTPWHNITKSR